MPLKDEIFDIDDLPREAVFVPEWKRTLYVRVMTAEERDSFELSISTNGSIDLTKGQNFRARLVALTCVNEAGERVFDDADVKRLGRKNGNAIARLFDAAQRLNALGRDDAEVLTGNFSVGQG